MNQKIKYIAFHIGDKIDLQLFQKNNTDRLVSKSTHTLLYEIGSDQFLYVLSYGVIVFSNIKNEQTYQHIDRIKTFTQNPKDNFHQDQLLIKVTKEENQLSSDYEQLTLGNFDSSINQMLMMHLAQSVTLDHYYDVSQGILNQIKSYTNDLQLKGKVSLRHKKALKLVGKSLQTKNSIAENLYIIDSPESTWENAYLSKLHNILLDHFELNSRHREIENTLKIIDDNLSVYISYNNHRESSRLEWIIIILIVIEVVDTFWSKL